MTMYPYLNGSAFKILAEARAEEYDQHPERQSAWGKNLRYWVGSVLVTLGHKMQSSVEMPVLFDDMRGHSLEDKNARVAVTNDC